jgi:hypothetical protein
MYAAAISIYDFKCFGKAVVDLLYPGNTSDEEIRTPNVNLILGDNGGGKSSVLRAIAIATLAPALLVGGFVAYRLVRRHAGNGVSDSSLLKVKGVLDDVEADSLTKRLTSPKSASGGERRPTHEFLARLKASPRSSLDQLTLESTPENPIAELIYDESSPAFFVVGYGATRRVETGSFSSSGEDKRRGRRYQRVASLFEDHVALRPMRSWFPELTEAERSEVLQLLARALPETIVFDGRMEGEDYVFDFEGVPTPFPALSDGYKAFIGWISDLLAHMVAVSKGRSLFDLTGIVLVDEIDLHLHPSWQRDVVARISRAFPNMQFVFTSHSPLVAASVQSENVIVTGIDEKGLPTLQRMQESLYGRSVEAVLMSPYFGLDSARPLDARRKTDALALQVESSRDGGVDAAEQFLRQLTEPIERLKQRTSR